MSKYPHFGDTAEGEMPNEQKGHKLGWSLEQEIRWIEHELLRARYGQDWEKSAIGENRVQLEVWLAKTRDKKSWKEIGDLYFSTARMKPEARRSEARRAYERVERYLKDPNAREFQGYRLNQLIQETFGVSARDFRAFILKGYLPRRG